MKIKIALKGYAGSISDPLAFLRWEIHPPFEQRFCPFEGIVLHQSRPFALHFPPDVDLVGDERWHATRQCFRDHNPKILLMRRKHEDLRAADGPPLSHTFQHSRPGNSICN